MTTSYVLRSGAGRPVFAADTLATAKARQKDSAKRGVVLRIFEQTVTEKEIVT